MEQTEIRALLKKVASGEVSADAAMLKLKTAPYDDIGFATLDNHRAVRCGAGEVIYGAGKSAEQIIKIAKRLMESGQKTVIITRVKNTDTEEILSNLPVAKYEKDARIIVAGEMPPITADGNIVIATGGTSDIPVAEEAAITAEALGNNVVRIYDVGVAGLHRLLAHKEEIMSAKVICAIAGMEGALASVIAGMADAPVIAVPTSVGYGASFGGVSALLSMLNSCAGGVSVVNIDNGFGAGYLASMINHIK